MIKYLLQLGFEYKGKCGSCINPPDKYRNDKLPSVEFRVRGKQNTWLLLIENRQVMSGNETNIESAINLIKHQVPNAQTIIP